jgi:mitogen-activated protein kinase 1/3
MDTEQGIEVAIKQVKGIFESTKEEAKRILREISILRTLNHPSIIRIRELALPTVTEDFEYVFIIMDSSQTDLKKLFNSPTFLDHDQVRFLMYQAVCGLRYMHSANILHRDLKPANILINEDCTLRICDFGLSRSYRKLNEDYKQLNSIAEEEDEEGSRTEEVKMRKVQRDQKRTPKILKRRLTSHVITRWYRAPEVILLERDYFTQVDIWSLGCVFAEMLRMIREICPKYTDRSPLFPGKSCFPLSPDVGVTSMRGGYPSSEHDQINMIFDVLGTPTEEDISFLSEPKALSYIRAFPHKDPKSLEILFRGATPDEVDLLRSLLVFNPHRRITIGEVLEHSYFSAVRQPAREFLAETPADFVFDNEADLTVARMKELFREEITNFMSSSP